MSAALLDPKRPWFSRSHRHRTPPHFLAQLLFCVVSRCSGDDDYFSLHDPIPHSSTFAKLPSSTPILFLFATEDEHTPNAATTQPALLDAWLSAIPQGVKAMGAFITGSHALKDGEGKEDGWLMLARQLKQWLE